MNYGLEDFRQIADEATENIPLSQAEQRAMVAACLSGRAPRRTGRSGLSRILAVSGAAACAAAVLLIFVARAPHTGGVQQVAAYSGGTAGGVQTAVANEGFVRVGAAAAADYGFSVSTGGNGLVGLKSRTGEWAVEPKYDSGYIENGVAYFTIGGEVTSIELSGIAFN